MQALYALRGLTSMAEGHPQRPRWLEWLGGWTGSVIHSGVIYYQRSLHM